LYTVTAFPPHPKDRPARLTLRGQVLRLTVPDLPLMLGLDLILGPAADLPRTRWEEAFAPEVLEAALRLPGMR
jgi:hypothetical protein